MYSLRWTFVSLARASGEAAFNVSRLTRPLSSRRTYSMASQGRSGVAAVAAIQALDIINQV